MPSWKVHRIIGKIVCVGFYDNEIDRLIDMIGEHDAGRYDPRVLHEHFKYVKERWGERGIVYYVLHHVLDRLSDILVSELSRLCEEYVLKGTPSEELYDELLKKSLERLRLDVKNFPKAGDERVDRVLRLTIEYIIATLEVSWEAAVAFLITDMSSTGEPMVAKRVLNAMMVKSVAYTYKYGRKLDEKLIFEFLEEVGDIARERAKGSEKYDEERIQKLSTKFKELLPRLEDALKDLEL